MRAVGQLNEDDAHIARHGQQHFAKRLGLVLLAAVKLQLVEFGQPINQFSHLNAKLLRHLGFGNTAVFEHIVHEGGAQCLCIQLPFGALLRHSHGVSDVGQAVFAHLAQVGLVGVAVGLAHQIHVDGAEVDELGFECSKAGGGRLGCCLAMAFSRGNDDFAAHELLL